MAFETLFNPQCVAIDLHAGSKKQLLGELTQLAKLCPAVAETALTPRDLLSAVMERERLGTTGIGSGVALASPRRNPRQIARRAKRRKPLQPAV